MIIIGITGGIDHGKTTLAAALGRIEPRSQHLESFQVIAQVADAWHAQTNKIPNPHELTEVNNWVSILPAILEQVTHKHVDATSLAFTMNDIIAQPALYEKLFTHIENLKKNPGLLSSRITDSNKEDYRPILQWLGGYMVLKIDKGIWYNELMRRADEAKQQGIQLCTIGGLRYQFDAQIVRAGGGYVLLVHRPLMNEPDLTDPTERERYKIQPDITVVNDAGIQELVTCAQLIYTDIKLGRVQSRYVTSDIQQ